MVNVLWTRGLPATVLVALLLLTGCGYRVAPGIPFEGRRVYVGHVANKTLEPGLEERLRTALLEAIAVDGRLKTAPEKEAEVILEATVVQYRLAPSAEASGFATQYEIHLTGAFVVRAGDGKVLAESGDVRAPVWETYRVGPDVLAAETARAAATERGIRALAKEFLGRMYAP